VKKAIDEHTEYNTAELDRSRPVKKGAATRRRLGEQVAVNTQTMGTSFIALFTAVSKLVSCSMVGIYECKISNSERPLKIYTHT